MPLLAAQAKKLYNIISKATKQIHAAKLSSKIELDSDKLALFYRLVFEHFSKDKDTPFNFIKIILNLYPPLIDFTSSFFNILLEIFKAVKELGLPASRVPLDPKSETSGTEPKTWGSILYNTAMPVILSAVTINIYYSVGYIPGLLLSLI